MDLKQTVVFSGSAYLSLSNRQMVIRLPEVVNNAGLPLSFKKEAQRSLPIEDIAYVILDNPHITVSHSLMNALMENNVALIICDNSRMPSGLMLPIEAQSIQTERYHNQILCSNLLKDRLWKQVISQKIANQAALLKKSGRNQYSTLKKWISFVKDGDPNNMEGRAAALYWKHLFGIEGFTRDRNGISPNHLLNYGYAILRAVVARSLVGSGLLVTLGIHHRNRYNAFCLADDIMEPYRPYVDDIVVSIVKQYGIQSEITKVIKEELLRIPVIPVQYKSITHPLMVMVGKTTTSLALCFSGEKAKIEYPEFDDQF